MIMHGHHAIHCTCVHVCGYVIGENSTRLPTSAVLSTKLVSHI